MGRTEVVDLRINDARLHPVRTTVRSLRHCGRRMAGRSSSVGVGARLFSRELDNQFRASQSANAIMERRESGGSH